jgi:hypothetical protein
VTGWGVVLLLAGLGGGGAAAWYAVRAAAADPTEGSVELRRMRLAEAGTTAGLVALIGLLSGGLSFGGTIGLLTLAVTAGQAVRAAMISQLLMPDQGGLTAAYGFLAVVCVGAVLVVGLVAHQPGTASGTERVDPAVLARDSARFGVPVTHHETGPVVTVAHRPTVTDADDGGGIAVPVERYALDGSMLTLQVAHHLACYASVVVIGPADPDGAVLDVIVLYGRILIDPPVTTAPPAPGEPDPYGCRPTGDQLLTANSVIEISLPAGTNPTSVRDTGAAGRAVRVR